MPTRAELLHDTRFQRVTAAILAGAIGRSAVELYGDLEELRLLRVWIWVRGRARARLKLGSGLGSGSGLVVLLYLSLTRDLTLI